jgi:predicted transcriptional regulator
MKNIISVSLSDLEVKRLQKLARQEKLSRSGVVREALLQYERRQAWEAIRDWGRRLALELNITSYDDVDRISGK